MLSTGILLAGCVSQLLIRQHTHMYTQDPDTLNYLMANRATTSDVVTNLVDGLLENDRYGNLVQHSLSHGQSPKMV